MEDYLLICTLTRIISLFDIREYRVRQYTDSSLGVSTQNYPEGVDTKSGVSFPDLPDNSFPVHGYKVGPGRMIRLDDESASLNILDPGM